ncbi:hypothetical protein AVEN_117559-1 [Araneus ventricosus]|uniref:Uncharacterized protein n=1 Tax=Araneus ventricosus TaxID=182803 RepID=A0A4Y2THJ2_ARAVE|nr:hypothetical protein AVEN_117559-1 [Araneus ventricosus]
MPDQTLLKEGADSKYGLHLEFLVIDSSDQEENTASSKPFLKNLSVYLWRKPSHHPRITKDAKISEFRFWEEKEQDVVPINMS